MIQNKISEDRLLPRSPPLPSPTHFSLLNRELKGLLTQLRRYADARVKKRSGHRHRRKKMGSSCVCPLVLFSLASACLVSTGLRQPGHGSQLVKFKLPIYLFLVCITHLFLFRVFWKKVCECEKVSSFLKPHEG